jgi:perosamine synthetase
MIPRGKLDIPFSDIFAGIRYCISGYFFSKQDRHSAIKAGNQLVTLSVRTGLDLTLRALNFPPGTEILVSDINIPDMFNILAAHQLQAIPISLNKYTLGIDAEQVATAITPATKAILIAHLFGGITELNKNRGNCERKTTDSYRRLRTGLSRGKVTRDIRIQMY